MTENEFRKLSQAERQATPMHVRQGAILYTHEAACELLSIEGFERIGATFPDDPDDESETWRRQVGGRTEWCELYPMPLPVEGLPPDQKWYREFMPVDPRTRED